jgi:hypothetical protein
LAWANIRSGANKKIPFPNERKGQLDYELLGKLGVNRNYIIKCDALLVYSLVLPLGDPRKKKLEGGTTDPRIPFYTEVEKFTNKYAAGMGLGGSYGHSFQPSKIPELLHFDMILVRDGVCGGSQRALHNRWDENDALYQEEIAETMSHTHFLQLKRTYKLNDNDYDKNSEDSCKKFDLIYKAIVHNTNALTLHADLDQCMDETTCGHGGYGPKGAVVSYED